MFNYVIKSCEAIGLLGRINHVPKRSYLSELYFIVVYYLYLRLSKTNLFTRLVFTGIPLSKPSGGISVDDIFKTTFAIRFNSTFEEQLMLTPLIPLYKLTAKCAVALEILLNAVTETLKWLPSDVFV